jgi:hypothetical protein
MEETKYLDAKRNRERRENLEQRRQAAVSAADRLRARPATQLSAPEPGQAASWQMPMRNDDLIEAISLWAERAKGKVLELDQEFNQL